MNTGIEKYIPLEVASPRSSGLAPEARARLLTGYITVIVPAYNEELSITQTLRAVCAVPPYKEVIVIDDGSTDGTSAQLQAFENEVSINKPPMLKDFRVVRQGRNMGKGAAIRTAAQMATGNIVLIQDADLELDPGEYPKLLEPFDRHDAHVVFGSRFRQEGTMRVHHTIHFLGNKFLTWFSNFCTGMYITDMETCYKAFRRELIQSFPMRSNRFGIEPELTARVSRAVRLKRLNFYEVPISYRPRTRTEGKKIGIRDGISAIGAIIYFNFLDKKGL